MFLRYSQEVSELSPKLHQSENIVINPFNSIKAYEATEIFRSRTWSKKEKSRQGYFPGRNGASHLLEQATDVD